MNTVLTEWDSFAKAVLPVDVHPIQRTEMRHTFYAGARAMLTLVNQVAPEEVSENAGVLMLELLAMELDNFNDDVKAGRA